MYLIVNAMDSDKIYCYDNFKKATEKAIKENKKDDECPRFYLYKIKNNSKLILLATLTREFGESKMYWTKDIYQSRRENKYIEYFEE
jgi:hypothetical protein